MQQSRLLTTIQEVGCEVVPLCRKSFQTTLVMRMVLLTVLFCVLIYR